jgi:outer membrane lipoprotein-sorting protein
MRWPALASILLLIAPPTARAGADPAPLEAWVRQQAKIRSLQADFTQERRLPSLKRPVTTKGRLAFRRPGFFRWELGTPPTTIAAADGSSLILADTAKMRARRIPLDSPEARRFTLLAGDAFASLEAFRKAFELRESRMDNGTYQATLRPLDRRMRSKIPWVFLTIAPAESKLLAMEIELSDGSRIRSLFTRTRINPELPDSRFHLDLSGYKVHQ